MTQAAEPWIDLFDGRTLQGWTPRGDAEIKVVAGEIHLSSQKTVWVVTDQKLSDFIFEAEVKVPAGEHVNSGIAFRCRGETGKPQGYQCEIDTSQRAWTGGLHAIGAGWVYPEQDNQKSVQKFLQQSRGSFKRDDWNRFRVLCRGDRIRIYVNGVLTTDERDNTFQRGFFGIQHHGGGGVYRFRHIRVKPFDTIEFKTALTPIPPKSPEEALPTIKTRPGFRIERVAAEPLVMDPIAMAFDENGRMFVVEFPEYNHKHAGWKIERKGVVRMLEDTDQDGTFDRSVIYVDQLSSPTAVACYDGGILVGSAPDLLFCKDTDGDGHADVRKVLFTGFAISENRGGGARLNSLRWGADHRFHLSTSFSGGDVHRVGAEETTAVSLRNRGFAFDPRTLEFEATSAGGQHGLAIDDWGRIFTCNNSDPFRQVIYESKYLPRNPHVVAPSPLVSLAADGKFTKILRISRVEPWRTVRTRLRVQGLYRGSAEGGTSAGFFTSATGVTVYRGDAFPSEYRGDIFVGEVSNNLIHRAKLSANGIELIAKRADQGAEFVASSDNWFRPVELANAPDGTLYVVDMYRELIETAHALPRDILKHLKQGAGVKRGRIYRIVPDGFQQPKLPRLGDASTQQLVKLLEHRNGWHRDTASRLLYQRQDSVAVDPLKLLAAKSELPQGRMAALYALQGLDALDVKTLSTALNDQSPNVRIHALRLAEPLLNSSPLLRQKLLHLTDDPSLQVRYQLAFSLGEFGATDSEARNVALAKLAGRDCGDQWVRFAILTSLSEGAAEVLSILIGDGSFRQTENGREFLMTLVQQISAARRGQEIASLTVSLGKIPVREKSLRFSLVRALVQKQRGRSKKREILAASGPRVRQILDDLLADAKATAGDSKRPTAERVDAIRSLEMADFDDVRKLLSESLKLRQPPAVQAAALDTLGEFSDPVVAEIVLRVWPGLSPQVRTTAAETLFSRSAWVVALLDAVEQGKVASSDVDPARISLLRKHPSEEVRSRVEKLFQPADSQRSEVVRKYQPALQWTGDATRGKGVFKKNCSACHKLEGVGKALGAELLAIRDRGPSALLLNILDPNREAKPKYLSYVLVTNDGRVLTGMIQSENANSVTLHRPDGTTVSVQRTEIQELRSTGLSYMPEGLEKEIDQPAMADLLEYLTNVKEPAEAKNK